jgi:hypothetical protein
MFRTSPIDEYSRVITIDGCDYEIVSRAVYGLWCLAGVAMCTGVFRESL